MAIAEQSYSGGRHNVNLRLSLTKLMILFMALTALSLYISVIEQAMLNWYLSVIWAAYLPIAIIGLFGAIEARNFIPSRHQGRVNKLVIFFIPSLARKNTLPALERVVNSISKAAPALLNNFRIDVVIDEGAECEQLLKDRYEENDNINIIVVPTSFVSRTNTRYKCRANQYALLERRGRGEASSDVFVYHLDDDTAVGEDTISSIAEFIRKDDGSYHLAQGILTFPWELSGSFLARLADSVRPSDDITRFRFFTKILGRPLIGLHGEHLLIRSSIEDSIEWEFGNEIVEDARFALEFSRVYPGKATFLSSCTYGSSPESISDLVKQRERWARGLIRLALNPSLPLLAKLPLLYCILNWITGIFQHVLLVLVFAVLAGFSSTSPIAREVIFIWCFNLAYHVWIYMEGLRINLQVSDKSYSRMRYFSIFIVPLVFVISLIEATASFRATINVLRGKNGFAVISKRL